MQLTEVTKKFEKLSRNELSKVIGGGGAATNAGAQCLFMACDEDVDCTFEQDQCGSCLTLLGLNICIPTL